MRDYRFRIYNPSDETMTYNVGLHRISEYADETLVKMQMTGLKDKRGNNVYEGDYLQSTLTSRQIGKVVFEEGIYKVVWSENNPFKDEYYSFLRDVIRSSEVCGNEFETPELLKQE